METTVGILVPVEIQVTQLSDLLDQYQKKPKTLKRFTVTGADSVQKDIKVWHVSRAFKNMCFKVQLKRVFWLFSLYSLGDVHIKYNTDPTATMYHINNPFHLR